MEKFSQQAYFQHNYRLQILNFVTYPPQLSLPVAQHLSLQVQLLQAFQHSVNHCLTHWLQFHWAGVTVANLPLDSKIVHSALVALTQTAALHKEATVGQNKVQLCLIIKMVKIITILISNGRLRSEIYRQRLAFLLHQPVLQSLPLVPVQYQICFPFLQHFYCQRCSPGQFQLGPHQE